MDGGQRRQMQEENKSDCVCDQRCDVFVGATPGERRGSEEGEGAGAEGDRQAAREHTDPHSQRQPARQDHGLRAGRSRLDAEGTGHVEAREQTECNRTAS